MSPVGRVCSECGTSLSGKHPATRTCSNKCRAARSRRHQRAMRDEADFIEHNPAGAQEISDIVRREAPDVVTRVLKQELQPIVREALTEDILRSVKQMIGLTPRAVELLEDDLESEDAIIRQRAYTLVTKYTIGHPALVKADEVDNSKQIVVNFSLPRPDQEAPDAEIVEDELRLCDMCGEDKPLREFVAGSTRCQPCFDGARAKVLAQFGGD